MDKLKTNLIYTAGLLDGEGCIRISGSKPKGGRSHNNFYLHISISNTNENIVRWLSSKFKGYVSKGKSPKRHKRWKPEFKWNLTSNEALSFLIKVFPYLRIKRRQTQLAITFQKWQKHRHRITPKEIQRKKQFKNELAKLNKRGR
jgi:hypothetical protein